MKIPRPELSTGHQAALRINLDRIATCDRLTQISGWVCGVDLTPAAGPISISLADSQYGSFGLRFRADLAQAGIASGLAAFDAVLPCSLLSGDSTVDVKIVDAAGSEGLCSYPIHQIQKFLPLGSIDVIEHGMVCGWIFGMPKVTSGEDPVLLLNDEPVALLDVYRERKDVPLDDGTGAKRYGFEFELARIHKIMKARFGSSPVTAKLSLAVNCVVVAASEIRVEADLISLGVSLPLGSPPIFSDFYLASLGR